MNKPLPNIESTNKEITKKPSFLSRSWKFAKRILFGLLALLLFVLLIFQIPAVQNWAGQKATVFLSKELNTKVSIDKLRLYYLDELVLEGFYIEDINGDSLLVSHEIEANLRLLSLFKKEFEIEEISMNQTFFALRKEPYAEYDNLRFLIDYFQKTPAEKKISGSEAASNKKKFNLNLNVLYLNDFHFVKEDSVIGQTVNVNLEKGDIWFGKVDLPGKRVEITEINFNDPIVQVDEYTEYPFPEDSLLLNEENLGIDTNQFVATIDEFNLRAGTFYLHNYRNAPEKTTPDDQLDFQHLSVFDINIDVNNFFYSDWEFRGEIEKMDLRESSGFVLDTLSAKEALINCTRVELFGLDLITPYSHLKDTLIFKYGSYPLFKEFTTEVRMDLKFNDSKVALRDIIAFAPPLRKNLFFTNNSEEVFEINGRVKGKINSLDGKDLDIRLPNRLLIQGNFRSNNLAVKEEQFMDFGLDRLRTSVRTMRQLIPNFNLPENFDKLGNLDFKGKFFGFFIEFVADGKLKTDLGRAEMDMEMNLFEGRDKARYSGGLSLWDFDLAKWSDDKNFGKITATAKVNEGIGLTLNTADVKLEAKIDSLRFKDYDYKNVIMNGELNQYLFDGDLAVKDKNINLNFKGEIDFTDSIPLFDFDADIRRLALKPLNFSKKDLDLAGLLNIQLIDKQLSKMQGTAALHDFTIIQNKKDTIVIDSFLASSVFLSPNKKEFKVDSDILMGSIVGDFDLERIPVEVVQFLERNYPEFANRFNIKNDKVLVDSSDYKFDIEIFDSKNLLSLVDKKLGSLEDVKIKGLFNSYEDLMEADVEIPKLKYDKLEFEDIVLIGKMDKSEGEMRVGVFSTTIDNKVKLSPVVLESLLDRDTLEFFVHSINFSKLLDNLNLNGYFFLDGEEHFQVKFSPSDLVVMNQKWDIKENNYIRFGKKDIETKNFLLSNKAQNQVIELASIDGNGKGLDLRVDNIDLNYINEIWEYPLLDFQGSADFHASVENLFDLTNIKADLLVDTILINEEDWGVLRFDADAKSLKVPATAYLSLTNGDVQVTAEGYYNLPTFPEPVAPKSMKEKKNYFDFDVTLSNFPIRFLEYLLVESIKDTEGRVDGVANLYGVPPEPHIKGTAKSYDVATTLIFLNTRYKSPSATVVIDDDLFDATGAKIYDELGNEAAVRGGITHDYLKNLGLDVRIYTTGEKFLALNTKEEHNPYFYGTGIGTGYAQFTGSFKQAEAYISATSGEGTNVVIPITTEQTAAEVSFISFPDENPLEEESETQAKLVRGLNLEMDLELNQNAVVEMIFDKQWGDVIKGTGDGNIKILMTRNDDFQMWGDYRVSQGEYLFTLMSVLVNKAFEVEEGGTIVWTGDPYNADIKLNAVYKGLSTSISSFILEYLISAPQDVQRLANTPTAVDLKMELTGYLLQPNVNFDIDFPNLAIELRNYTDSKLRTIRQDQNELNRQVFGLLILKQFLPSGQRFQAADIGLSVGINTVSEMVANQLSIYLTELLSEFITDGNLIAGIDIDLSYNKSQLGSIDGANIDQTNSELETRLKIFVNDRLSLDFGGNFGLGDGANNPNPNNTLITGEFVIEYDLTKDKKFKIRAYNRTEPDIAGDRRRKTGFGLSFRKEFDSLKELMQSSKKKKRENEAARRNGRLSN